MLSTPLICCSIGVATDCSRVCASAPTYVANTCTSGGAMLGNWAIGKLSMVRVPTSTMMMEITMATMGRLMKNWIAGLISFWPQVLWGSLQQHALGVSSNSSAITCSA